MNAKFAAALNRGVLPAVLVAAVTGSVGVRAQEIGTVGQGFGLARAVCAECHNIEQEAPSAARDQAPNFEAMARTPGMTALALRVALQTPHMTMPNLMLDEESRESVIKYILSLK